jgi:DNA-binding sugar fermentation-stimulating protein
MSTFDTKKKQFEDYKLTHTIQLKNYKEQTEVIAIQSRVANRLIPMVIKNELKAEELSLKYLELGINNVLIETGNNNGYMIKII